MVRAAELIRADEQLGTYLRGTFVDYPINLRIGIQFGTIQDPRAPILVDNMTSISSDLWNLWTLLHRLERTTGEASHGSIEGGLWRAYCGLDVESFFTQLRSIADYAARCIRAVSAEPGVVPGESLNDLRNWLEKNPGNVKRLGEDLAEVVRGYPTFAKVRAVRDSTVHQGAYTLVFGGPNDGLQFQVFRTSAMTPIVDAPGEIVGPNNLVDFRRYAALLVAELLLFLQAMCVVLAIRLPAAHVGVGEGKMTGAGLGVVAEWMRLWSGPTAA